MSRAITRSILFLCVMCFSAFNIAGEEQEQENLILKMNREVEEWNMGLLAKVQAKPDSKMKEFVADGCSGGLSAGWNSFADVFPAFKKQFGDRPPWEYCCMTHDKDYWQGETDDGFEKRLKSDQILRQCVKDWGKTNSQRLSKKFDLSQENIETQVNITAELMYSAIRMGGKPCSFLPWRWGFGWPHCSVKQQFE